MPGRLSHPSRWITDATFWFYAVSLLVLSIDQGTKFWIRQVLPVGASRDMIPGVVSLTHILNTGAAFGMFPSGTAVFTIVSVGVCAGLIIWQRRLSEHSALLRLALSLELGGALGNLVDRVIAGHVTDFIDLDTSLRFLREYPVFNVADMSLTVGAVCIVFHTMKGISHDSEHE